MKILHLYNQDRQKSLLGQNYTINIKPHLLYFSTEKKHKNWAEKPHSHEFTEIAFIVSGTGTTTVDGTVKDIYSGDIIIYNAGVTHSLSCHNSSPFEAHIVAFDQFEITGLRPNCLLPPQYDFLYHSSNNYNTFRVLFRQILVETDNKDVHYHEIAQSTSYTLLMYLLRMINKAHENMHENSQNEVLKRALDFIDKHYLENTTLDKIAENCFISKYNCTFNQSFYLFFLQNNIKNMFIYIFFYCINRSATCYFTAIYTAHTISNNKIFQIFELIT